MSERHAALKKTVRLVAPDIHWGIWMEHGTKWYGGIDGWLYEKGLFRTGEMESPEDVEASLIATLNKWFAAPPPPDEPETR